MKSADERIHQAKGKLSNSSSCGREIRGVNLSLEFFFNKLKEEAPPFATWIIREKVGMSTRDDDPDNVVLPPHITKRGCYARWCYSQGWKVHFKSMAKSILKLLDEYEKRPIEPCDEDGVSLWPPES
eukprot:11181402-Ditylum_brightwellii.AAC.1